MLLEASKIMTLPRKTIAVHFLTNDRQSPGGITAGGGNGEVACGARAAVMEQLMGGPEAADDGGAATPLPSTRS